MRKVFNIGVGLVAVIGKNQQDAALKIADELGEEYFLIGKVE